MRVEKSVGDQGAELSNVKVAVTDQGAKLSNMQGAINVIAETVNQILWNAENDLTKARQLVSIDRLSRPEVESKLRASMVRTLGYPLFSVP